MLLDPQTQNSYAYARNNPIVYKDPDGLYPTAVAGALMGAPLGPLGMIGGALIGATVGTVAIVGGVWMIDQAIANFSQSGKNIGTPRPTDAPAGTKPIDKVGLPKDLIHDIKNPTTGIGAKPNDWVGLTPKGDVVTAGPDGKTINHGPAESFNRGSGKKEGG